MIALISYSHDLCFTARPRQTKKNNILIVPQRPMLTRASDIW